MLDGGGLATGCLQYLVNSIGIHVTQFTTGAGYSWAWWNHTYSDFIPLASYQAGSHYIFGPLCQTVTVTVGVNINNSIATTTAVPCLSYLSQ